MAARRGKAAGPGDGYVDASASADTAACCTAYGKTAVGLCGDCERAAQRRRPARGWRQRPCLLFFFNPQQERAMFERLKSSTVPGNG
ncbi:hypothetical protein U9M48_012050 [Paspalum notatum var. saurae]|uniref:Uncharacterized protein n=1 Tax=Paspalum notatum var. saurae TaxID=547442 RepID=A0AAQ3WHN5_PASNO